MIRNLKVLGLAIAAVLAVSAVGASATYAAFFHSEAENTSVSGSQTTTHVFNTDVGEVTCKSATFAGFQSGTTAESITITPTYSECTLLGELWTIPVNLNFSNGGCDYHFSAAGHTEIKCTKGNVVVSGAGCTVTVPAQTLSNQNTANVASYSNTGTGKTRDIDVTISASTMAYSYSGFVCGTGSGTRNGFYTGTTTMDAAVGIWWG